MKKYTLYIRKVYIYLTIMAPVFMLLGILSFILSFFYDKPFGGIGAGIILLSIGFLNWKRYLYKPVEIDVYDNKAILRNIFKKETEILFSDMMKIEVEKTKSLKIITKSQEIIGVFAFDNFDKFITDIKQINPRLITNGL